jgi:hypothetical protein
MRGPVLAPASDHGGRNDDGVGRGRPWASSGEAVAPARGGGGGAGVGKAAVTQGEEESAEVGGEPLALMEHRYGAKDFVTSIYAHLLQ